MPCFLSFLFYKNYYLRFFIEPTKPKKTLGRKTKLLKLTLNGYARIFNAKFDNFAFLNIQKIPGQKIEAGYFEIDASEVKLFEKREAGSRLVKVKSDFYAFIWPEYLTAELPVLFSYVNACVNGANELKINFWQGTKWPKQIIDDRLSPLYEA